MSRILYVATSDIHLKTFHVPYLEWLASEGHTVDIAAEQRGGMTFECVHQAHWLPFPRTLASLQHFSSYQRLRGIIETGRYDLIHCHTPIPSALTRLAARKWRKKGGKLLYTAHGFHFFEGAPLSRWLTYYPIEQLLSLVTDGLVTMNSEDYARAERTMRAKSIHKIPGIGIDLDRYRPQRSDERAATRSALGYSTSEFLVLYVAEFIPRKNHALVIRAARSLVEVIPEIRFVFAGVGRNIDCIRKQAHELGLERQVEFLGFRNDVERLSGIADVGISASRHEGLPMGIAEQMACGVPVVASDVRGNCDLIEHGVTGFLFKQGDEQAFVEAISRLYRDRGLRIDMGERAIQKAKEFSLDYSLVKMKNIYQYYLKEYD